MNEAGETRYLGETALIPPRLVYIVRLAKRQHQNVYYSGMPMLHGVQLRRHGDQICRYPNATYSILGRVDDTMNLGRN